MQNTVIKWNDFNRYVQANKNNQEKVIEAAIILNSQPYKD